MTEKKMGKIINNTAGVKEEHVGYSVSAYTAAKAALINFMRQLAAELECHIINVNAIDQRGQMTEFSDGVLMTEKESYLIQGIQTNKNIKLRLRQLAEVIPTIIFLIISDIRHYDWEITSGIIQR